MNRRGFLKRLGGLALLPLAAAGWVRQKPEPQFYSTYLGSYNQGRWLGPGPEPLKPAVPVSDKEWRQITERTGFFGPLEGTPLTYDDPIGGECCGFNHCGTKCGVV